MYPLGPTSAHVRPEFDPNSRKKIDQIFIEEDDFINNYTLVENEIIEDERQVSKLLVREPISIIPKYDYSIKNKEERIKSSK